MNKVFTFCNPKTSYTVSCENGTVTVLSAAKDGERLIPSVISLPKAYADKNGENKDFRWELKTYFPEANGVSALFCDNVARCHYKVTFKTRLDIPGPCEFTSRITNFAPDTVRIILDEVFSVGFAFDKAPTAWRIMKESGVAEGVKWKAGPTTFFEGTGIYKDEVKEDAPVILETNTCQDFNRGGHIPWLFLDGGVKGAYVVFEWTSCRITATAVNGGTRVAVDLRENFSTRLPAGASLDIAPIYFGVYDGDVDDGSNEFKSWFFKERSPKTLLLDENEPLVQMDPNVELEVMKTINGMQSLKWDYGWWGNEILPTVTPGQGMQWKKHEGSWKLRSEGMVNKLKDLYGFDDLSQYGALVRDSGFNFTLYVLLHDSQTELDPDGGLTSVGEGAHPEWFSNRKIAGKCPVADLGNKDCVEFCKRKLYDFFVTNNVRSWRSDFEPIAFVSDKENRHDANGTDVQYWCSMGFYEIVDYLIENLPGFRYESCSSGGSMKDHATMHRATVFNNDDSADFISLRTTFYDSSYAFPPSQLQWPLDPDTFVPECERHYAGLGDKDFGMRNVIMAPIMLGSHCGRNSEGHLKWDLEKYYNEYLPLHNEKIKPLMRHANLYHVLPRPDSIHWDGMQYGCDWVPDNKICGASFIFKPSDQDGETKHIPVRGLNPDITYSVEFYERGENNFTATGKELMEKGIDLTIKGAFGSEIIFYVAK